MIGDGRRMGANQDNTPQIRPVHSADSRASSSTGYLGTNEFEGNMIGDPAAEKRAVDLFNKTFNKTNASGQSPEEKVFSLAIMTRHDGLPDFNLYDVHRGPSLSQGPEGMTRNPNFQPNYEEGSTITWFMDSHNALPAYIPNCGKVVPDAVRNCFEIWNRGLQECGINLRFAEVNANRKGSASVKISFQDKSDDNLNAWSGTGGELAYASATTIVFDQVRTTSTYKCLLTSYIRTPGPTLVC